MEFAIKFLIFLLVTAFEVWGNANVNSLEAHNSTLSSVPVEGWTHKSHEMLDYGSQNRKYSAILPSDGPKQVPKSPRGFAVYEGYYDDKYKPGTDSSEWSPYHLQHGDTIPDGTSNVRWNVQKKTGNRQDIGGNDFQFAGFNQDFSNQDFSNMLMMMQTMKKMDQAQKPGLLSRILDNPTALVMVTFIPISLLLVAVIPLVKNLMTNGVNIPPIISTTGAKSRKFPDSSFQDITVPILRNLANFGSRYLENPDCLHRIFCEMASENAKSPNYLRRALDTITFITNDNLMESLGMKTILKAVKTGKCGELPCTTKDENSRSKLIKLMDDIMYKHSQNIKPNKR